MPLSDPWDIEYPNEDGRTWQYPPFNYDFDFRGRYIVSSRYGYGPEHGLMQYDSLGRWYSPIQEKGFWVGARTAEATVVPLLDMEYLDPAAFATPAHGNLNDRYFYKIDRAVFLDDGLFMLLVNAQAAIDETIANKLARWQLNMALGRISGMEVTLGPWTALHEVPAQYVPEARYRASHWHNDRGYLVWSNYLTDEPPHMRLSYQRWALSSFEVVDGPDGPVPSGLRTRRFAPNANTLGTIAFDGPRVTTIQRTPAVPFG